MDNGQCPLDINKFKYIDVIKKMYLIKNLDFKL